MKNEIFNLVKNHRSIRKYKDTSIDDKEILEIIETAMHASSSGNMQCYSVIITKDKNVREKLCPLHFDQSMVLDAPVLITVCADFNRMRTWIKSSEAADNFDNFISFMIATIDATLFAQNFALLAESLGLGICFMGTTLANAHLIGEVLNCPKNVVPVLGFSLGYPDEYPEERKRLPVNGMIHQEKYQNYSDETVMNIYENRNQEGMKRYLQNSDLKKRVEELKIRNLAQVYTELKIRNLAQVYTELKYTRVSHQEYSRNLLNYLKEQCFMNN